MLRSLTVSSAFLLLSASVAYAQDTRAEALERQRAEKAKQTSELVPSKIERGLIWFERKRPLLWIAPYNGFFVTYGYSEKPVGSGIGFGGGWRHDLFERNARLVLEGGQTFRGYLFGKADFSLPRLLDERLELGAFGKYRRETQEDFYGLGIDTSKDDRTDYRYEAPEFQGRALFRPTSWFTTGVRGGRTDVKVEDGSDVRFPDISRLYGPATAPGLNVQPAFIYGDVLAAIDLRDQPIGPRAGAYYSVVWRRYSDREFERFSFNRLDADFQHFIPFLHRKRVIATRVQVQTTAADSGNVVPFYFQPTLGGSENLRSASDYRYRDGSVVNGTLEYRFEVHSGLDVALFTDQGTVAPRFRDIDWGRLKGAYGIGFRFNALQNVWMRLDIAGGGNDGIHGFFKFSGTF